MDRLLRFTINLRQHSLGQAAGTNYFLHIIQLYLDDLKMCGFEVICNEIGNRTVSKFKKKLFLFVSLFCNGVSNI